MKGDREPEKGWKEIERRMVGKRARERMEGGTELVREKMEGDREPEKGRKKTENHRND